jgi:hypothetical protein
MAARHESRAFDSKPITDEFRLRTPISDRRSCRVIWRTEDTLGVEPMTRTVHPARGPQGFVPATKKPLGDLAWAYFKSRPEWRKVKKDPEYHISANLLKGTEENYRWLGVDWPENGYLLIGLSGDADIKTRKPMQAGVVNGWRCRYDLQTGKFDVPPLFSNDNAKAVVPQ